MFLNPRYAQKQSLISGVDFWISVSTFVSGIL